MDIQDITANSVDAIRDIVAITDIAVLNAITDITNMRPSHYQGYHGINHQGSHRLRGTNINSSPMGINLKTNFSQIRLISRIDNAKMYDLATLVTDQRQRIFDFVINDLPQENFVF